LAYTQLGQYAENNRIAAVKSPRGNEVCCQNGQ